MCEIVMYFMCNSEGGSNIAGFENENFSAHYQELSEESSTTTAGCKNSGSYS